MDDQCEKYGASIRLPLDQIFDASPVVMTAKWRDGFTVRRMCKQHSVSIKYLSCFLDYHTLVWVARKQTNLSEFIWDRHGQGPNKKSISTNVIPVVRSSLSIIFLLLSMVRSKNSRYWMITWSMQSDITNYCKINVMSAWSDLTSIVSTRQTVFSNTRC